MEVAIRVKVLATITVNECGGAGLIIWAYRVFVIIKN